MLTAMEMAIVLIECIKDYPVYHSTPYLVDSIVEALRIGLPGIGFFLDSRILSHNEIFDDM